MTLASGSSSQSQSQAVGMDALLRSYQRPTGQYDELFDAEGRIRPAWQPLAGWLRQLSQNDRLQAFDTVERLLRDNGVSFIAHDDRGNQSRLWQLDPLPFIIEQEEWSKLEAGLIQRAEILNRVMADIYGPQKLLGDGLIPPALVFSNPAFLRPCHDIEAPDGIYLHFVAFDLARSPSGDWWVLSDRTEAPNGTGFALENRVITSRAMGGLFSETNVVRVASFYRAFNESFLAQAKSDHPLVTVLSPGSQRETYFEHAYLAQYLGYDVVVGQDLTVRDDQLFMKTVDDLRKVDLVVRRIESRQSDPLELDPDTAFGVPGLLQAARAKSVVMANSLGSGIVESDALMGFLPALSKHLLGEELKLPSVATWWCGQEKARQHVLDNIDRLVVRHLAAPKSILAAETGGHFGPGIDAAERRDLADRINWQGHLYVGQELLGLSHVPVWQPDGRITSAPMTLRVYLAATKDGFIVMPGGLTRVITRGTSNILQTQPGDISKDTWVVSPEPVETVTLLPSADAPLILRRSSRDLPSRAADNLFWFGRYLERLQHAVRLLRALVSRVGGESRASGRRVSLQRALALLEAQRHITAARADRAIQGGPLGVARELSFVLFDKECSDGLVSLLDNVKRLAEELRERLSLDTWQLVTNLIQIGEERPVGFGHDVRPAASLLNRMIMQLAALNGMMMENMTRGLAWRFLDLGGRVERGWQTTRLLQAAELNNGSEELADLDLLLELADSVITYSTRYKTRPRLGPLADLLLMDESNPRSLLYQLLRIEEHLAAIPPEPKQDPGLGQAQKVVQAIKTELQICEVRRLCQERDPDGRPASMDRLMLTMEEGLDSLSGLLAANYFSHAHETKVTGPSALDAQI